MIEFLLTDDDRTSIIQSSKEQGRPKMKQPAPSKLREDLTEEQKERALKIGRIEFKSARPAWDPGSVKFAGMGPKGRAA
jgi:hypothetical protein